MLCSGPLVIKRYLKFHFISFFLLYYLLLRLFTFFGMRGAPISETVQGGLVSAHCLFKDKNNDHSVLHFPRTRTYNLYIYIYILLLLPDR